MISSAENKNNEELMTPLTLIGCLAKIFTIEQAKQLLLEMYQIKTPIQNFPLGTNGVLNIKENSEQYSIKITYTSNNEKECVIYNYKK